MKCSSDGELLEVAAEPPHHRLLVLRRPALRVQVDELESILEGEARQLAGGVLSHPESAALDRSAEAHAGAGFGGHERMFSRAGLEADGR